MINMIVTKTFFTFDLNIYQQFGSGMILRRQENELNMKFINK